MKESPTLSIVIPVYNEEHNVEVLYKELRQSADLLKKNYELIFVDDGSSDTTFDRLKEIKKQEIDEKTVTHTRIILLSRNFGQTAAMQAGFDYSRGDIIIAMDGDLQNDPRDISRLVDKLNQGYDVVCGWRKNRKDKTLTRILPSKVANWLIGKITGILIHDNGCSLKAYRSSVIKSIRLYSDMHRFIPAMTTLVGARIAETIVNHRPRKYGKAKYGLSRIWKVLFDIFTIKMIIHFNQKPILWFASLSLIFFVSALGLGIASVVQLLQGEYSIIYPATSFLLFFLCASLLFWGLLAEFFVKIERAEKGGPSAYERVCILEVE